MLSFFIFLTALGNPVTLFSVFIVFLIVVTIVHRRLVSMTFLGAVLTGSAIVLILKTFLLVQRPYADMALLAFGNSFPSAHALLSTVVYGFIGFYLWHYSQSRFIKFLAICIGGAIPFLVGFSRIYLGVHWISDVVGGWAIGTLILFAWFFHFEKTHQRDIQMPHLSRLSHIFLFVVVAIEVVFIGVASYLFQSNIADAERLHISQEKITINL